MRVLFMILILLSTLIHVLAVSFNHVGMFSRSSREPKYRIKFHPEDSPFHPDDDQKSMVMPDKNGQKYICFLPKVKRANSEKPVFQHNISSIIVENKRRRVKQKTPDELLEALTGRCFIMTFKKEDWWTYQFCYQKKLRQLHLKNFTVVEEYILGKYDAEATAAYSQNLSDIITWKDSRSKSASERYHVHKYTNGTACNHTNKPRETEVRFVCSKKGFISKFTELSTCKYALTVYIPSICEHPLYKPVKTVWRTVNCNVPPKDYKDSKVEQEHKLMHVAMVTDTL